MLVERSPTNRLLGGMSIFSRAPTTQSMPEWSLSSGLAAPAVVVTDRVHSSSCCREAALPPHTTTTRGRARSSLFWRRIWVTRPAYTAASEAPHAGSTRARWSSAPRERTGQRCCRRLSGDIWGAGSLLLADYQSTTIASH
ncbi:hypothetical protein HPB49_024622 [Dermacentor silvarum]|uniref:Uncharacterized protein n=1 Tax=Dermacentor silvarum TaxID=543639 RepID=A0ACB8CCB8_DERSI|nr:hypothetical protein HPB49_024622 [Dermacentor silvarum]